MKVTPPKDNNEIVITIMSILEKITGMEKNITDCQNAIVAHAEEARASSKDMYDTVGSLQYSVTSMQKHIAEMQLSIKDIVDFSLSITAVARFVFCIFKIISGVVIIGGGIVGILKALGKI